MLSFLLFGDGCGACLVSAEPTGLALDRFHADGDPAHRRSDHLAHPRSGIRDASVRPGARPHPPLADGAWRRHCSATAPCDDIALWAVHAGGRSILDAVQHGLALPPDALRYLARRAARFRQHVVRHADLRAGSHPALVGDATRRRHGDGVRAGTDRGNLRVPPAHDVSPTRSTAAERMDTDCVDYDDYRRCLRDLSRVNTVTLTHRPMLAWLARETGGAAVASRCWMSPAAMATRCAASAAGPRDAVSRRSWTGSTSIRGRRGRRARRPTGDCAITYRTGDVFAFEPTPTASTSSSARSSPII